MKRTSDLQKIIWTAIREQLGNRCELCGSTQNLHIEHDHETETIRGLVCAKCNFVIAGIESLDWFNRKIVLKASPEKS